MRTKSMKKILCMVTTVAVSLSSMFSAPQIWAAASGDAQNMPGQGTGSDTKQPVQYDCIKGLADETMYDTDGNPIRACGGEVHEVTENGETKWYWFGEDVPSTPEEGVAQGLHLYSSTDLYNWTREEDSFRGMTSKEQFETDDYFKSLYGDLTDEEKNVVFECLRNCPTAHPKVFYNGKNDRYVMWVPGMNGKMCIAVSDSIKGPFKFVKYCESVSGFVTAYQDRSDTVYIVYRDNKGGLTLAGLTQDYMDIASTRALSFRDGVGLSSVEGAMFERNGKYYMVNAATKQYAVADSLNGTWTVCQLRMCDEEGKICADSDMNPTSCILQVNTENGAVYINISDKWDNMAIEQPAADETRYIWLPLAFSEDGTVNLKQTSNWNLKGIVHPEPTASPGGQGYDSIDGLSGEILYDTEGRKVYACGGEVHQIEENGETKWYWFGVDDLDSDSQRDNPGIHLYSSDDLYNWEYEGIMDDNLGSDSCLLAHPKILYNKERQEYVMWVSGGSGVIVATSKSIKGPFVKVSGAGDGISTFCNLYQESDGTAYILYSSQGGLRIAKLSADYMKMDGDPQVFCYTDENALFNAEGGVFKKDGKYYIINAGNPGDYGPQYAEADSLDGPWTVHNMRMWDDTKQEFENIVEKNQTSNVFHVKSEEGDTYVCVGDSVGGSEEPGRVRYIWLPIKFFDDGTIALEKLSNWRLGKEGDTVEVTEVTLTESSKTMKVGDVYQITAGVLPTNATDQTLTYTSSDESVATVSASGQVAAGKAGEATITVTSVNGKTAQFLVTVEEAEEPTQKPIETSKPTSQPGGTERPTATEEPTQKPIETSKPTSQPGETERPTATEEPTREPVETEGPTQKPAETAKPTKKPEATEKPTQKPTATAGAHGQKPPVEVTRVILTEKKTTIKVGDTYQITAVVLPADATDKGLTYKSSNESVATVSANGKVVAVNAGKTTITVTASNGKMEQMQLTVVKKPAAQQRVLVSEKSVTMGVGEKVQLEAVVYPKNASNKKLTYRASNNKVGVNGKGKVTARKPGKCKITISLPNGESAVVKVTVKKKPNRLSLNAKKKTLKVGKKFLIKPRLPKGTASYKITFVSGKETVAVVSKSGKVTAKKKGDAVIVVKTYNGIRAVLKIHVK